MQTSPQSGDWTLLTATPNNPRQSWEDVPIQYSEDYKLLLFYIRINFHKILNRAVMFQFCTFGEKASRNLTIFSMMSHAFATDSSIFALSCRTSAFLQIIFSFTFHISNPSSNVLLQIHIRNNSVYKFPAL